MIDSDMHKREATFKILKNCVSIIDDNYIIEKEEEEKQIIENIVKDFFSMTEFRYTYDMNNVVVGINIDKRDTKDLFAQLAYELADSLTNIVNKYSSDQRAKVEYIFDLVVRLCDYSMINKSTFNDELTTEKITAKKEQIQQEIKKLHPDYQIPQNSGGCYVATAVYGSYDCPQVWTLRRYRDYTLAQTGYGRAFIKTYYAISPTLVKWFGHTDWFRNMWKPRLDKIVKKLNNKGVKNLYIVFPLFFRHNI